MPRAKKGQQKVPTLMKTTGLCPSRSYYSMHIVHSEEGKTSTRETDGEWENNDEKEPKLEREEKGRSWK